MTMGLIILGAIVWGLYDKFKRGGRIGRPGDRAWAREERTEPEENNFSSFVGYLIFFVFAAPCSMLLLIGFIQSIFGKGPEVAASASQHLRWGFILLVPAILAQLIFRKR